MIIDGIVIVRYDTTAHSSVSFVNPSTSAGWTNKTYIEANISTLMKTGVTLDHINISLYNSDTNTLLQSVESNTTPYFINYTGLPFGNYGLVATATDNQSVVSSTEIRNITIGLISIVSTCANTTDGNDIIYTCLANGTFNLTLGSIDAKILIVGGGAGGGGTSASAAYVAGGGGGGDIYYNASYTIQAGQFNITIGQGGAGGSNTGTRGGNGTASGFGSLVTGLSGGGGGSLSAALNGISQATGGGAAWRTASGTAGTGSNGGNGGTAVSGAGGGGGAGGNATDRNGQNAVTNFGGSGGNGSAYTIYNGTSIYYAGGGGGGSASSNTPGNGGSGGGGIGGDGLAGVAGTANTGGGGGGSGATATTGGAGGSGIIIIRYTPPANTLSFENPTTIAGWKNQTYIDANVSALYTGYVLDKINITLYDANGTIMDSVSSSTSPLYYNFTGLPNRLYYLVAKSNDTIGNVKILNRTIILAPFAINSNINYTTVGYDLVYAFLTNGTFNVTGESINATLLAVAGGGGGGGASGGVIGDLAGGGGGGGILYNSSYTIVVGSNIVVIGAGGAGGTTAGTRGGNGTNSSFGSLIAIGGGGGGGDTNRVGANGGTGGGGGYNSAVGVGGNGSQGGKGGSSSIGYGGGGGGGGLGTGTDGVNGTLGNGGDGGNGTSFTIYNDSAIYYAGGGGGGSKNQTSLGIGGLGGGGTGGYGTPGTNGTDGLGGGGGGGEPVNTGSKGGSGIVIVRIPVYTAGTATISASIIAPTTNTSASTTQTWIAENITATVTSGTLDKIKLFLYNSTGLYDSQTFTSSPGYYNWTNLPSGAYYWNATANSTTGVSNSTATRSTTIWTSITTSFISPTTNTTAYTTTNHIEANVSAATSRTLTSINISLYNSTGLYASTVSATSPAYIQWTFLPDGTYYWNATATASDGIKNITETRSMILDTVNPTVSFVAPTDSDSSYLSRTYIISNVTATDTNFKNVTTNLYNSANTLVATSITNYNNFTGLTNGLYHLNATAYDYAGNQNITETRNITIDIINPAIQFVSPTPNSGTTQSTNAIAGNVTATDTNLYNITIRLYNSTGGLVNSANTGTSPNYASFPGLADGLYYINATAYDLAGNSNKTETRNITISTSISVSFVAPTTATSSYTAQDYIEANASESGTKTMDTLKVFLYNSTGLYDSQTSGTTPLYHDWTSLPDGAYYWNSTVNATDGTSALTETRSTIIDTTPPVISFVAPTDSDSSYLTRTYLISNVTATDTNFKNVTTRLYNSTGNLINSSILNYNNFSSLANGLYHLNATAYDLAGNSQSTETRNITIVNGTLVISFVSPTTTSGTIQQSTLIVVNATSSDPYLNNITIKLGNSTGGLLNTTSTVSSPNYVVYTETTDGLYYFNASGLNLAGVVGNTETRNVTIDTTPPAISIISPTASYFNTHSILINISATDLHGISAIWFYTNGTVNQTYTAPITLMLNDGVYNMQAWANDTVNNINTTSKSFTVDTIPPAISFVYPTPATGNLTNITNFLANVSASDTNLHNVTVNLYNSSGGLVDSGTGAISLIKNFSGIADGIYYYNATAYDLAGNSNSTETRNITVDTTAPVINFVPPTDADGSTTFGNTLTTNVTAVDLTLQNITINLYDINHDFVTSVTTNSSANLYNVFSGLYGNLYYYNATAYDYFGLHTSTATRTLQIYAFNLSISSPTQGETTTSGAVPIIWAATTIYPHGESVSCTLYLDGAGVDTQITTNGVFTYNSNLNFGIHTAYLNCHFVSNPAFNSTTSTVTFNVNYYNFSSQNIVGLGNNPIIAGAQALIYDGVGDLVPLYYTNNSGTTTFNIAGIRNNSMVYDWATPLNQTKTFYVAMRDVSGESFLSFNQDNTTYNYIYPLTNTTWLINKNIALPFSLNVNSNSQFNPAVYASTKQFTALNISEESSYYVFWVPNGTTNSVLVKRFLGNGTLSIANTSATNAVPTYMTMAKTSDLLNWYVVMKNSTATNSQLALYVYDGTSFTKQFTDNVTYTPSQMSGISSILSSYQGIDYWFIAGAGTTSKVYQIQTQLSYTFPTTLTNISSIIFVKNDTFIFVSSEVGNPVYSCYFNSTEGNCSKMSAADYGVVLPVYTRGAMTATKQDTSFVDWVSYGTLDYANGTSTLTYTQTAYDNKFICWNEMAEFREPFTMQILSGNHTQTLGQLSYGYVIPSRLIPPDHQKAYAMCQPNGTLRMTTFSLQSNAYLNMYSLQIPNGAYYTFVTKSIYGATIPNILVTAERLSPQFAAYVPVEQGLTDSTGSATLYLQPFVTYQIMVSGGGYTQMIFFFTPVGTTTININLNENFSSYTVPSYDKSDDVTYQVSPQSGTYNYTFQPKFTAVSPDGQLNSMNFIVYQLVNGTTTLIQNNTISIPVGGTMVGPTIDSNITASYIVQASFIVGNRTSYSLRQVTYYISPLSPIRYVEKNIQGLMDGWTYYLLATFAAILVGGFVSRYTVKGAGLVAVGVLWVFTIFNPSAIVYPTGDVVKTGLVITTLMATIIATVFAVVAFWGSEVI